MSHFVTPFVLFDDAQAESAKILHDFVRMDSVTAQSLDTVDSLLHQGWNSGLQVAVFIPYEFAYAISDLEHLDTHIPLCLYWFKHKVSMQGSAIKDWLMAQALAHDPDQSPAGLANIKLSESESSYSAHIEQLLEAMRKGDMYQVNYTIAQHFRSYGSPINLYQRLRQVQAVPYGVLSCLPKKDNTQDEWTLCFSPELFIALEADGSLLTEPMKGTLAFSPNDDIEGLSEQLRSDIKNRAENLMIVDLLRNDLSKLAKPNSVKVEELFKVSPFGNVLQMTTPIRAQMKANTTIAQLVRALFPCGSITGAPKRMSMEYISQHEQGPRGIYTGSIGFFEPSAQGIQGKLNVAIRTLVLEQHNTKALDYTGIMGVGGGIVIDSTAPAEYEEVQWKASFLRRIQPKFSLFETMRIEHGQCVLLDLHIKRILRSAKELNFNIKHTELLMQQKLNEHIASLDSTKVWRMKLLLNSQGDIQFEQGLLDNTLSNTNLPLVKIAHTILPKYDTLRQYKTTYRERYDEDLKKAMQEGFFDVLYFNEEGQLLEGARTSVFVLYQGQYLTPSLDLDILSGVMRQTIMANPSHYFNNELAASVQETTITYNMLKEAERIYLSNALRGCIEVVLV